MKNEDLIALTIWWCEGTKLRKDKRWKKSFLYAVEVTNSDPQIIKFFINYLFNKLHVPFEKIHGQIQIHKGDNLEKMEKFWSSITGIPKEQFNKTIIRPRGNKPGKNNGTFKIRVYNKELFMQLKNLLEKMMTINNIDKIGE